MQSVFVLFPSSSDPSLEMTDFNTIPWNPIVWHQLLVGETAHRLVSYFSLSSMKQISLCILSQSSWETIYNKLAIYIRQYWVWVRKKSCIFPHHWIVVCFPSDWCNGLLLVKTGHVTWILAYDWTMLPPSSPLSTLRTCYLPYLILNVVAQ